VSSTKGPVKPDLIALVPCPSVSQRASVDSNGWEVTFDPTSSASPTPVTIDAGAGFHSGYGDGVACPSVSQCTSSDGNGREVTCDGRVPDSGLIGSHPFVSQVRAGLKACRRRQALERAAPKDREFSSC
jgi:hypothetical protein